MKKPNVIIKDGVAADIGMSHTAIEQEVCDAVVLAERIAHQALQRLDRVMDQKRSKNRKKAWEADATIRQFFGDDAPTVAQMRRCRRRVNRLHRRLADRQLTIRVLPQPDNKPTARAQNLGSIFSPKTFKVFPAWFGSLGAEYRGNSGGSSSDSDLRRAAIIVHELNHDLFADQKLNGQTVYGEKLAMDLADAKPRKARRSSENFEWFCMRLQDPSGKL